MTDNGEEATVLAGPDVPVPWPKNYGAPGCPVCGYRCGCCCSCSCQTACDEDCEALCHEAHAVPSRRSHQPWECHDWSTRYDWAKAKSAALVGRSSDA